MARKRRWSLCSLQFASRRLPSEHERPAHPDRCGGGVLAICGGPSFFAAARTAVLAQAFDNRRFRLDQGGMFGRLEGAGEQGISGAGGSHRDHTSFGCFCCGSETSRRRDVSPSRQPTNLRVVCRQRIRRLAPDDGVASRTSSAPRRRHCSRKASTAQHPRILHAAATVEIGDPSAEQR